MTAREPATADRAADIAKRLSPAQRRALCRLQIGVAYLRKDVATCLMRQGLIFRRCQYLHVYDLTYDGERVAAAIEDSNQGPAS